MNVIHQSQENIFESEEDVSSIPNGNYTFISIRINSYKLYPDKTE